MKKIITLVLLLLPTSAHAQVLINEIAWMGTDVSASDEWIELYNSGDDDVDLASWKITAADGSPNIALEGTISAGGYFLLERTDDDTVPGITANLIYSGALGNTGENLKLLDADTNTVDEIISTEDSWLAGDNTTKQTMERADATTWLTSLQPLGTPKAINSQFGSTGEQEEQDNNDSSAEEDEPAPPGSTSQTKANKGDIAITEIFPNPAGVDLEKEFVELQNQSGRIIDLTGWKITNAAKQEFILPSLTMNHGSIVVFYRSQTGLALNNNKEKITLYSGRRIIDRVEYNTSAPEELSYQIDAEKNWHWETPSPGEENNLEIIIPPVANIDGPRQGMVGEILTFDASDSFDPLERDLQFYWEFGDGRQAGGVSARQIYITEGKFEISLTVSADAFASSTETLSIKIVDPAPPDSFDKTDTPSAATTSSVTFEQMPFVFISEFLPNPVGSDVENEFIEIFNQETFPVSLSGWQLSDKASKHTIKNAVIKPGQYLAFPRPETKIALNNDEDEIRLTMPDGRIADLVTYDNSKEGQSYVLDEQFAWRQSSTPSPGEINILDEEVEETEPQKVEPKILGAQTENIQTNEPKNKDKYIFSGIAAFAVLGMGLILKKKKA